jgi:Ca2+-binding RTX toxin-like protein
MADFVVINQSTPPDHVRGGPGDDSLTVIFEGVGTGGVWLENVQAEGGGSWGGVFNGPGSNDILFTGIERFGFDDRSGGDDIVRTFEGDDTLDGGAGNDLLHGGAGVDRIDGGAGTDRAGVDLSAATAAVRIDLNGISTFLGTGRMANVEGFHDLSTGAGADRITGHRTAGLADEIRTGAGKDRIRLWMGGTDTVDGGAGTDTLVLTHATATNGVWLENVQDEGGGSWGGIFNGPGLNDVVFTGIERISFADRSGGNDIIRGLDGADTIEGGGGGDVLAGGGGRDVFVFNLGVGEGGDRIEDFQNGLDRIRLAGGSFADVTVGLANPAGDALLTFTGGTTVHLAGVAAGLIGADDFLFA